jgi:hypothetical protein
LNRLTWHKGLSDWVAVQEIEGVILPRNQSAPIQAQKTDEPPPRHVPNEPPPRRELPTFCSNSDAREAFNALPEHIQDLMVEAEASPEIPSSGNNIALGLSNFLGGLGHFVAIIMLIMFLYAIFNTLGKDESAIAFMGAYIALAISMSSHILAWIIRKLFT